MNGHELAAELLQLPNGEIMASTDIDTGIADKTGETVVAKIFSHSACEVFHNNGEIVILFENAVGGGESVDVIEATKDAVNRLDAELPIHGVASENTIIEFAIQQKLTIKLTGVKRIGGEFILLKDKNDIRMSFMRVADGFQRVY